MGVDHRRVHSHPSLGESLDGRKEEAMRRRSSSRQGANPGALVALGFVVAMAGAIVLQAIAAAMARFGVLLHALGM